MPYARLPSVMCMRGEVSEGYGRGSKKLGVPTANLPSSLFSDRLQDVPTGVYLGWAALEETQPGSSPVKAVVNIGFSPTFEGKENKPQNKL